MRVLNPLGLQSRFGEQTTQNLRFILIGELFFHNFDIFFAQFFNLQYFPYFWRISRVVTERFRVLIQISNYFQTLEIKEKTLSDKSEPNIRLHKHPLRGLNT